MTAAEMLRGAEVVAKARFLPDTMARTVVAPVGAPLAPLPLLTPEPDFVDAWLARHHQQGAVADPFDVSCYFARDVEVTGRGHVFWQDALLDGPEFMPLYWRKLVEDGEVDLAAERALPARVVDEPCVVFAGHGIHVYGHFLLETLPRLFLAHYALDHALPRRRYLIDADAPAWLRDILCGSLGVDEADLLPYAPARERMVLRQAILPTLTSRDGQFHPYQRRVCAHLCEVVGAEAEAPGPRRLFLTRALVRNPHSVQRHCVNELELAGIAAREFGFAVLAPETFPWAAQLALLRHAEVVAGVFGSALHSAMFSPPGTRVGAIGVLNLEQSHIGALQQHRNAYLRTDALDESGAFSVDEDRFRAFLRRLCR